MALAVRIKCNPKTGYSFDGPVLQLQITWELVDGDVKDPETGELFVLWTGTVSGKQNMQAEDALKKLMVRMQQKLYNEVYGAVRNALHVKQTFGTYDPFKIAQSLATEFSKVSDQAIADALASGGN